MRRIRFFFATLGLAVPVALLAGGCSSTPDTTGGRVDDPGGEAAQSLETQACYGGHPRPTGFWAGAGNADDVYGALNGTLGLLGPTFASGKVGQAFAFNGLTDIRVADSPALTFPTAMTIEAWINPSNVLLTQAIVGKNRALLTSGYNLLIGAGKLVFGMNNGTNFGLASNATLSANTWTHVAATRNGNVVKLYINGVLDATSTSAPSGNLINSTFPLTIGSEDTVLLRFFTGLIDEPAVWGADLTAAQIAGIYAAGADGKCHCVPEDLCATGHICSQTPSSYTCGCPAGFTGTSCEINIDDCTAAPCQNGGTCVDGVNSYTCTCAAGFTGTNCEINIDECASAPCQNGGTCADGVNGYTCECASGWAGTNCETQVCYGGHPQPTGFWAGAGNADDVYGALNGTLGSGVTFAAGQVGQAFVFNGANDIQIPDSASLTFPTTLTIEAWINPTNSVTPLQAIVSKNRGVGGTGYAMSIANGKLGFGMNNGTNFSVGSSGTISLNTWTHVAVTRNANVVKLYINGVLDTTVTNAPSGALTDSNRPLTIGSEDTVSGRFFTGLVDEPAVWGADLTAAQIAGIHAAGAAGKCHCAPEDLCATGHICSQTPSSYTCDCPAGFTGPNCETPAAPPEPTIGCYDYPANSGNTGVDDLYYLGPIDTIDNVRFYRAPRDGTCSGSSYQSGLALITAASAAEAETKCQSLNGGDALDASIWNGLAGFWVCAPAPGG